MEFRKLEISDPKFETEGLRYITVKSPSLKMRADISVFIPEQAKTKRAVPVIILLHGVYGSHWAWAMKGNAHRTLQHMIDNGESEPFILAMPSDGLWGDGSGFVPHSDQDFEAWIGQEVPEVLTILIDEVDDDSKYFISGLSMGGYGAFRIGTKYSHLFDGISGHSSITDIEQMGQFVEENWQSTFHIEDGKLIDLIRKGKSNLNIRFDCGKQDGLLEANRQLHSSLVNANIDHKYEEYEGEHNWEYWEERIKDTYTFFTQLIET